jgi:hypothetical protein
MFTRTNRLQPPPGKRSAVTLLVLACLAASALVAVTPAQARDSNCTAVSLSASKSVTKYIVVAGWGLTSWRVSPSINAWDRCSHGELKTLVSLYDANVTAKGGRLRVTSVAYQTTGTGWKALPLVYTWPSWLFWQTHVDLLPSWRITNVRINTAVERRESTGWVGIASDTMTCSLVTRSCS